MSAVPGFMALLGLTIEHADAEEAVVRMDVPDALMSPFGAVHGGFIAALLDTGFGVALPAAWTPPTASPRTASTSPTSPSRASSSSSAAPAW